MCLVSACFFAVQLDFDCSITRYYVCIAALLKLWSMCCSCFGEICRALSVNAKSCLGMVVP